MATDDAAVARTVSAVSAASAASDNNAVVNKSLEGLVSAMDELKKSLGLGNSYDFAEVEEFVEKARQENEEFRQFAEDAIKSAQRLKAERDELQARLDQSALEATMGTALAEAQKLKNVTDEFEKDLYESKLADAEARAAEAEGLKERIAELEEENAGLTQTLNEFRATTQQLQRLQSHEVRRLQAVEAGAAATRAAAATLPPTLEQQPAPAANGAAAASPGSSPAGGATPKGSPRGAVRSSPPVVSAEGAAAARIAGQLEEVAGGANSGLLAEAALALRELSKRDASLQVAERELVRLRAEVEELNDTMFSKTFKPPSAWAEREIKYKSERKYWEEQQKEVAARLAALSGELEAHRGAGRAAQLEGRIQDLEARLLQSERERDSARAALHELQLSLRTEGEFGAGGRRLSPYKRPLGVAAGEGHEVAQLVERLDGGGGGPQSPGASSLAAAAERMQGVQAQLAAATAENTHLRRRLQDETAVEVPPSLHGQLGPTATAAAVSAAAAQLEAKLAAAEAEGAALRQQLGGGGAAATAEAAEQAAAALEARAAAAEREGEGGEADSLRQQAAHLSAVGAALRAAEEEQAALRGLLADLAPVRLQLSTAAGSEEEVEVPPALQPELGPVASAAAVEAKAAELDASLADAEAAGADLHRAAQLSLAAEAAAAAADAARRVAAARLAAAGTAGEAEVARAELAAAQRQKEEAVQQLREVAELREQLQGAEGERRRLAAALRAAAPVTLRLAVGEAEGAALEVQQLPEGGGGADVAALQAELQAAEQQSAELRARLAAMQPAAPVALSLQLGTDVDGGASERLAAVEQEAAALRAQLADLAPVRLQLRLDGPPGGGAAAGDAGSPTRAVASPDSAAASPLPPALASLGEPGLTAERSSLSLQSLPPYSSEQANELSQERAAADAALLAYQKSTDVPSLLRAKAELETRCQMLEAQLAKMQSELATVDEVNAVMEHSLDSALRTGDVTALGGLKERLKNGTRMFRRQGKVSPSKDSLKNTVHEMQDALTSSEGERNALKRQLAKLSKKYQQVTQQQAHTAGIVAGAAAAMQGSEAALSEDSSLEPLPEGIDGEGDGELEMLKMREENQMLMEHVVMVKVRQAEMEGEYLEAKRQLARTREKNMQLLRKLAEVREAAEKGEPLPLTPKGAAPGTLTTPRVTPAADASGDPGQPSQPMRKGLIRIPGL